jgi:hypothetical protein
MGVLIGKLPSGVTGREKYPISAVFFRAPEFLCRDGDLAARMDACLDRYQ